MDQWLSAQQHIKSPVTPIVRALLTKWVDSGEDSALSACTFWHIVQYWHTGQVEDSLPVALADAGFTREELDARKTAGTTLKELVYEMLARES